MRKKKDKKSGVTTYVYNRNKGANSNLENMEIEIQKCKKTISDYSQYLDYWKWNYEKAKKEYDFRLQKIEDARTLMGLLQEHIDRIKSGEEDEVFYDGRPSVSHDSPCDSHDEDSKN